MNLARMNVRQVFSGISFSSNMLHLHDKTLSCNETQNMLHLHHKILCCNETHTFVSSKVREKNTITQITQIYNNDTKNLRKNRFESS